MAERQLFLAIAVTLQALIRQDGLRAHTRFSITVVTDEQLCGKNRLFSRQTMTARLIRNLAPYKQQHDRKKYKRVHSDTHMPRDIKSYFVKKGIFIYYSHYSNYRMQSSIQLSKETKELLNSFGSKEDTYEDIIKRMYKLAVKEQLRDFLFSSEGFVSIEEARKRLNK